MKAMIAEEESEKEKKQVALGAEPLCGPCC